MPTLSLTNERLGKRFSVVMDAAGWDVAATADVLGISRGQVYKYIAGTTLLPPERATKMAEESVKHNDLRGADSDAVRSYLLGANLGLLFGGVSSHAEDSETGGSLAA